MRYYDVAFNTNGDQIVENARVDLREYGYYNSNPLLAVNDYMYRNLKNDICFVVYREVENALYAVFSFDEQKISFRDAYDHIAGMLYDAFHVSKIALEPNEITMREFTDCFQEAKRRNYFHHLVNMAKLWFYYFYTENDYPLNYVFEEKIIPEQEIMEQAIFDKSLKRELSNIKNHESIEEFKGNITHYVISGKSTEAINEMIFMLMQRLYKSNRISSKRISFIHDMEPGLYMKNNHIEEVIENSFGGVVVFDLSEKLGYNPVDYTLMSKFLEKLVKKYRNQCLFVFSYNIDHPGFSYQILPNLSKYVIPIKVKEGHGNRKSAIKYLESLISKSEYSEYTDQAKEFMELFSGNTFSQTDVINAFDRFESWCINKNVLNAYDYNMSEDFMLDREVDGVSAYDKLNKLIGLKIVKQQIESIIATDIVEKERKKRKGNDYHSASMHMVFGGNPGSAKTTVATLFAGIAKERGILKSGAFVERGGMDLDGLGCVSKIRESFMAAMGGVLFIDEAYSMVSDIAVTTLIQEMENKRDDVIVILAGYNERMQEFMKINEGLKSRVPHWIDFPDYTADELTEIFKMMVTERGFSVTQDALKETRYIFEKVRNTENFGNGRYVRNLIDRAAQNQAVRLLADGKDPNAIKKSVLFKIIREDICELDEGLKDERPVGTARKELDDMIGLSSVKEVIRKAVSHYKLRKICIDKGIARDKASMHMVFTGNPGTAKTSVARLFAEILKDEKILPTGVFVEVGRADLVGDHVGSTAPLVKKKFKEAQGGVLFIDEAYSLCDSYSNGFGDEAINTLVQEMENHRDDVIVIFAGYPEPMKQFLDRNPGMLSRIAFHVEFDDYSTDELCDIASLMVKRKNMTITDKALDKLRTIFDKARDESDYGNGRFVRKMLEEAEMNLAERIESFSEDDITTELITTIEECDIPLNETKNHERTKKIGFIY